MNEFRFRNESNIPMEAAGLRWLPRPLDTSRCADLLLHLLLEIQWHADSYIAFGRRFEIPRLQAWFAESGIQYRYANNFLPRQEWIPALADLKLQLEELSGSRFNSVLATYYRDGMDSVDWHADDEAELGPEPWIVSMSLGAEREFRFRHKTQGDEGCVLLCSGDLLLMEPQFQQFWEHAVPSQPLVREPRVNLTFRMVVNSN